MAPTARPTVSIVTPPSAAPISSQTRLTQALSPTVSPYALLTFPQLLIAVPVSAPCSQMGPSWTAACSKPIVLLAHRRGYAEREMAHKSHTSNKCSRPCAYSIPLSTKDPPTLHLLTVTTHRHPHLQTQTPHPLPQQPHPTSSPPSPRPNPLLRPSRPSTTPSPPRPPPIARL